VVVGGWPPGLAVVTPGCPVVTAPGCPVVTAPGCPVVTAPGWVAPAAGLPAVPVAAGFAAATGLAGTVVTVLVVPAAEATAARPHRRLRVIVRVLTV
jgi:hypothetical protein